MKRFTERIRRNFGPIDFGLIAAMILLIVVGLLSIYSATTGGESEVSSRNFQKQLMWLAFGSVLFIVTVFLDPKLFQALAYLLFGAILLALVVVLFKGMSVGGATRWISLGGLRFQPSEWAKLATIIALARYLTDKNDQLHEKRSLVTVAAIGFLPMLLIFKQPDLGTSLVFLAILPSMLLWAGVSPVLLFLTFLPGLTVISSFQVWSFFILMFILTVVLFFARKSILFSAGQIGLNILVGMITPFLWNSLEVYQQGRVLSFLGLVSDPKGISYQVIQSKVAIGSGGITGKGFLAGSQTQLRFLPEQHTDFIFSVIGEEFGILGSLAVIVLFVIILICGIHIAASVKNRFMSLVALGVTTMFLYHYFVNLGMVMGIMPVTGLPLPFISYGGSFLCTCMAGTALLVNISINRHEY